MLYYLNYSKNFFVGFFLYSSNIIIKYASISGPKINPITPKIKSPPIIPIKIIPECICVRFDTINGLKKLSIVTDMIPKIESPITDNTPPPIKR